MEATTVRYPSGYRKHRYELVDELKNNPAAFLYINNQHLKLTLDCRIKLVHTFRPILGVKQYDVFLTKEQLVLAKITILFEREIVKTKHSLLRYRIDLYFLDYMLAIEIYEKGQCVRSIDYEIKIQKAIEQELSCEFTRINRDKEGFDICKTISKVFQHTKQFINPIQDKGCQKGPLPVFHL